jgi:putative protein-disulfide isomerase
VTYYTDPACPYSWAAEPALRRLQVEFAEGLTITYVMGGLAREFRRPLETMRHVMDAAAESGMPTDPRLWLDAPPTSSYPACQAVKAAAEQNLDGPYLRVVREGLMVDRLKLDTADALIDAARRVPGMDVERFAIDLRSHAIVEAFGADLDEARALDPERFTLPTFEIGSQVLFGAQGYEALREAALAGGALPPGGPAPDVPAALTRFRRMASVEVEAVCGLAAPPANAELWRLAAEWRVKPLRVLTGLLWELA